MSRDSTTEQEYRDGLTDRQLVACTMLGEARGDAGDGSSVEEQLAVGCLIRNRVRAPRRFGRSYRTVCLARGQFSCWWRWGGEANYLWLLERVKHLTLDTPEADPGVAGLVGQALWLAEGVVTGQILDVSGGADHYYAPAAMVPAGRVPDWALEQEVVAAIGGHLFYRLVAA